MTTKEYLKFVKLLQRYNYEYHTRNQSSVSDHVYDDLMAKLKAFEKKYPRKIVSFSPTQRVGAKVSQKFTKVRHRHPMLSLNDAFSLEELDQWRQRLAKLKIELATNFKRWSYFVDLKMDGLALALIYEDGLFKRAVTRGDGQTGEDVTINAKTISNLPLKLPKKIRGHLEVRGEVIIYKKDFLKINQDHQKANKQGYANARNLASGTMRQLNPQLVGQRALVFKAYDIMGDQFKTQQEVYRFLGRLNFSHNHQATACRNFAQLKDTIGRLSLLRSKLPFETDGLVIKINNRRLYDQFGSVGKAPRGALAYKYPAEQTTTTVEKIILQIGRTGVITPVAVLKPVQLAGTTVTHASLHNADEIDRLDVRLKDTVVIFKAGDIIPKIDQVIVDLRPAKSVKFNFATALKKQHPQLKFRQAKGQVAYKLVSGSSKQARKSLLILALIHYASRLAVDIPGLGKATSRLLVESGLVSSVADIYKLQAKQLLDLPKFGQLASQNLITAIASRKKPSLNKFIFGLGIPHTGSQTALDLAQHFKTFHKFRRAKIDDLQSLEGIGTKTATAILAWLNDSGNQKLLQQFSDLKVKPLSFLVHKNLLANHKIVITGTLKNYSRQEARQKIIDVGGKSPTQISRTTTHLVVGQRFSATKVAKAQALKIPIINEDQFEQII